MLRRNLHVHRADDVEQALALMASFGDDATPYAGGTELVLVLKLGLSSVEHLVDVRRIPELTGVDVTGTTLRIGAATTHWGMSTAPVIRAGLPALARMERTVGNLRVQTTGTLGGNLCFADPQSDPATFLVATGASVVCVSSAGRRRSLPVEEFVLDAYSTALQDGELLVCVEVPVPAVGAVVVHRMFAFGERPDVTCAAVLETADDHVVGARVVLGSSTGHPMVLDAAGGLAGRSLREATAGAGDVAAAGVDEVSDGFLDDKRTPHARALARTLVERVVREALTHAQERSG
jgi:carbon-monoxide dehydrogenase medium subunit